MKLLALALAAATTLALPGIASMAGTYLSFLWWQIAGGHGGRPDSPAALWFLPSGPLDRWFDR